MTTFRVGVIGDPVAHSISPAMQQAAFDHLGIVAVYERWRTPADQLATRVESLRGAEFLGANVTVPHKQVVMAFLDEVTPLARRAGAVNTIINQDGRLLGDNTDVHGFASALLAVCPNARNRNALVLGAGGAARGVVLALEAIGVQRISVANRNLARAMELAAELAPLAIDTLDMSEKEILARLAKASLLINATSLGWHMGETPLPLEYLVKTPPNVLVIDLTYRDSDLLLGAREAGRETLDGLAMLVHQGARSLELWTGQSAPLEVMFEAARQARATH